MDESDITAVMQEPPGGHNHGRIAVEDGHASLDGETVEFLNDGGWSVVDIRNNKDEAGGLTSHRGVLHPDEYVDKNRLQALVEEALGFTYAEIAAVYREGRPSITSRQLRDKIDARLLALSRSGGNMLALAKLLGWTIKPASEKGGASCDKMERALARAREAA